jgi:hypothetical protein
VGAVESFLRRYAAKHFDCCEDVELPRRNEPRRLYRTAEALPVLREWQAKRTARKTTDE